MLSTLAIIGLLFVIFQSLKDLFKKEKAQKHVQKINKKAA